MFAFIPAACGVAMVLACILTYQTGKGTMRVLEQKKRRNVRKNRS